MLGPLLSFLRVFRWSETEKCFPEGRQLKAGKQAVNVELSELIVSESEYYVTQPLIFEERLTVAMAREINGIRDPSGRQLFFF